MTPVPVDPKELDLEAVRSRVEAASVGPWKEGRHDLQSYDGVSGEPFTNVYGAEVERMHLGHARPFTIARALHDENNKSDAEFIAHARTDIPILIAEVERQAAEIERLGRHLKGEREALAIAMRQLNGRADADQVAAVEALRHSAASTEIEGWVHDDPREIAKGWHGGDIGGWIEVWAAPDRDTDQTWTPCTLLIHPAPTNRENEKEEKP